MPSSLYRSASENSGASSCLLSERASDLLYLVNSSGSVIFASQGFLGCLGPNTPENILGKTLGDVFIDQALAARYMEADEKVFRKEPVEDAALVPIPGGNRLGCCTRYAITNDAGAVILVLCVIRDVTRDQQVQEAYQQELEYLFRLPEDVYAAWLINMSSWKIDRSIICERGKAMLPENSNLNEYLRRAINAVSGNDEYVRFFRNFTKTGLMKLYSSGKRRFDFEYLRQMPDDSRRWLYLDAQFLTEPASGTVMLFVVLRDINHAKTSLYELTKAAERDAMTGLLNHDAMLAYVDRYLTGEGKNGMHAMIMIDRDGLKAINDTLGHPVGDDVIIRTAATIRSAFFDTDLVGRMGGDEFLVLMKNANNAEHVRRKARELLQSLQYICGPAEHPVESTASIGIALYKGDGRSTEMLYAIADMALYKAKENGKNRYVLSGQLEQPEPVTVTQTDSLLETVNLRFLLNSIDGGVLVFRANPGKALIPVFFSDSFLQMMGDLTQEEALLLYGKGMQYSVHLEDREHVRTEYLNAVETGTPLRTTCRLIGKHNVYYWLSVGMNIIRNADGSLDAYAVHTNIDALMHKEEKLVLDEQRFRLAFAQNASIMYEVDIAQNAFVLYDPSGHHYITDSRVTGLPEAVISSGMIHAESAEAFRAFYQGMCAGNPDGQDLFQYRYRDTGTYGWASFSYNMLFQQDGTPEKAIGSIVELPNISGTKQLLTREIRFMELVQNELLGVIKINLSQDKIEYLGPKKDGWTQEGVPSSYSRLFELYLSQSSFSEDAILLRLNLERAALLNAYANANRCINTDFRYVDDGEIRWASVSVRLLEEPVSREVQAFVYISDAERRRSIEAVLPLVLEKDAATQLYTKDGIEQLIDGIMRVTSAGDRLYALSLLHISGLPPAHSGGEGEQSEKAYLCRYLSVLLGSDCLLGHYGSHDILVFSPDAVSADWMQQKLDHAFAQIRAVIHDGGKSPAFTLSCGISVEPARTAGFMGMLAQAKKLCEVSMHSDAKTALSFEAFVDTFRISQADLNKSTFSIVTQEELTRPLFGNEREVFSDFMAALLSANQYDSAIAAAFGVLGRYYKANRLYSLTLLDGNNAVSGLHEWVAPGKRSLLKQITGIPLAKLPLIKRALTAAKPIVLDNQERQQNKGSVAQDSWRFVVLPIIIDSRIRGFLCMEEPAAHMTDVALLYQAIPILLHERSRYHMQAEGMRVAGRDALTRLPDRASFHSDMLSFNPDAYHSVGALYVNAVKLREVNRDKGVEYGDEMLVFAAQTLSEVCSKAAVYRISGQEFAVISTNLSNEAFTGQCSRVRSVLLRRYPKRFACGEAWSSKSISARKLFAQAEELTHINTDAQTAPLQKQTPSLGADQPLLDALSEGRFTIYLQPKVDMRTGRIIGAESLVRCRDAEGKLILPSEFIGRLEYAGMIRELDFFMLNQTLFTLHNWLERGITPLPISVNISRWTLLDRSLLASALAIHSRYDVPERLIELEITESTGDCESEALRRAMEGLRGAGFRLAMDDLGSEYSSLKLLGELPFDTVKLDRELINSFLYRSISRSIVESIISACSQNNIQCIAEGVETQTQCDELLKAGCIYAQGYLYGKPMPVEDFERRAYGGKANTEE